MPFHPGAVATKQQRNGQERQGHPTPCGRLELTSQDVETLEKTTTDCPSHLLVRPLASAHATSPPLSSPLADPPSGLPKKGVPNKALLPSLCTRQRAHVSGGLTKGAC
mmetsp:Transcript_95402/g.139326  ORF Transcript_95402/g.139326 Transcript_95402/m.139326 type:complete len:108 (+) Transcript_95402:828-1151(+)